MERPQRCCPHFGETLVFHKRGKSPNRSENSVKLSLNDVFATFEFAKLQLPACHSLQRIATGRGAAR